MVRLKRNTLQPLILLLIKSQFHYGSIKTQEAKNLSKI